MTQTRWDVLGIGCNSVDHVYRLPTSPRADSRHAKLRISSHQAACGGQMATAMSACASMGLKAAYLGTVGSDERGALVIRELQARGVDVSSVMTRDCPNRFAIITVDEMTGERIVLWDRDDRLNIARSEINPQLLQSARLVHVDDEDPDCAIAAATMAREAGLTVTSDIELLGDRTGELIAAVTIPIFAQHVLPALTDETDLEKALKSVRLPHHTMVCTTLGSAGAAMLKGNEVFVEPAFKLQAVDTTGAGDVFRAAFICALLNEWSPREILRFANAAAAASCARPGAIASVPSLQDVARVFALSGG